MFRSKISSILQSIVSKSSYNIGHTNLLSHRLLSTDTTHGRSTEASNEASSATITENLNKASPQSDGSITTSHKAEDTIKTTPETSNKSLNATILRDSASTTEPELDKLYKKLEIEVRGNDQAVLRSYGEFVVMAANNLDIIVGRNVALRKPIHERLTVLKSVHVHKKHRVQYETRTYYRYIDFFKLTGSTADTFLEYIQRNLPEGIAMKVTKVELQNLPDTVQQAAPL